MKLTQWLPFGRVPGISPEALQARLKDVQILDVRTPAEFRASHIEQAVNLPITRFSKQAVSSLGLVRNVPVVTICLSAHRSIPATRQLLQLGYDASQLDGGMKSWWKKDYQTVRN